MTGISRFKYKRAFWAFISILLAFMVVSYLIIVSNMREQMLSQAHHDVQKELDNVARFVREPLLKHDYAKVEEFLNQWAEEHKEIVELRAVAPDNFVLSAFKRDMPVSHLYVLEKQVSFGGRELVKLTFGKDLSHVEKILGRLQVQLIIFSVLLTAIFGVLLWRTIRAMALKPLEWEIVLHTRAEEMLKKAKDELEARVLERTAELQEANRTLLREIDERKNAVSALKESEERFRAIFDSAMDGILLADTESRMFMTGNRTICRMLGYSEDEIKGMGVSDIHTKHDLPFVFEQFDRLSKEEITVAVNVPVRRKDGTVFSADISSSPVILRGKKYLMGIFRDVTERMNAEEALKEAVKTARDEKAKLDAVIAAIGDGISIQNTDYRVIYQNEIHKKMIGDHIGEYCYEAYEHSDGICGGCPVDMAIKDGKVHVTERSVIMQDRKVHVEITASPLRDSSGKIIAGIELVRDISERKEAESALMALSARNEAILSAVPDIIMEVDANKVYTWANKAGYEFFGNDVLGREASFYFEGEQETYRTVSPLFSGEENVIYVESWQRRRDGQKRLLAWWCRVMKDEKGNVTGALSSARDITEQQKSEDALRTSEEKFSKAFRSSPAFVTINTLLEGRFVEVNDTFLTASGFSRGEMLGRSSLELGIWLDRSDRDQMVSLLLDKGVVYGRETRFRMKSGEVLNVLYSAELIDIAGEKCIIAVILDITERKRLESQLLQAQKMEAVGQLAGGIAHDFNNIITAIFSYGYLLQGMLTSDNPANEYIGKILSLSDRAAQITRGLLTFSRKQNFEFVPVRLNDIIRNIKGMLENFIGEDIEVVTVLSDSEITVVADRTQIEQIIINLATNARDAMPDGGKLYIETELAEITESFISTHGFGEPGMYALLRVADTGTGMDEETRQRIFEPFYTTKEVGRGTGLGLSIVYGIIKQHNGYINVYSEPGRGTTFSIYLPEIKASLESAREKLFQVPGKSVCVLVAEDETAVRDAIKKILEQHGHKVMEAADGLAAVETFAAFKDEIELVLMDVVMPVQNGKEAYEAMKRIKPGIKAIFMSGYTADTVFRKKISEEDMTFITKPVLPDRLLSKIREVVDNDR